MGVYKLREIRNSGLQFVVCSLVALWFGACATPQNKPDAKSNADAQTATEPAPSGPFEAAHKWAGEVAPKTTPEAVREIVSGWKSAQVARVWAVGEEYRAVIVQKNTARETPAVLLRITQSDANGWEVSGVEPSTSTYLWSEL